MLLPSISSTEYEKSGSHDDMFLPISFQFGSNSKLTSSRTAIIINTKPQISLPITCSDRTTIGRTVTIQRRASHTDAVLNAQESLGYTVSDTQNALSAPKLPRKED